MCGIVGYLNKSGKPAELSIVEKMSCSLSHRGPHGEGSYIFRNIGIGHRRLAIIDLETGKQPMANEDDSIWISYNGELYNYKELRKILKEKGHSFKTQSDTEVIIHAYEEWGKKCVEYFRGMFAIVIIDTTKNEIFLARDHIGIKPLVYYNGKDCFAFGSEIQALHALPEFSAEINVEALDQYMSLHYIPAPLTIYINTYKILPAQRMVISFGGDIKSQEIYWDLRFSPDTSKNENDWLEGLDSILRESVKKHLIADVPVGAFLSGGIDSTIVVKYMTELQGNHTPKTFSIGFDVDQYSELAYSDIVSSKYGTNHYSEIVTHNSIDILPNLVKHYGEPFGDDSCIPTYYLSQFASKQVTVVLSGDGGDEFFIGYPTYERWFELTKWRLAKFYQHFPLWKKMFYPLAHHLYNSRYPNKYFERYDKTVEMWIKNIKSMENESRKRLWKEEYHESIDDIPDIFKNLTGSIQDLSPINSAQYIDIKTALPSALLKKVDIASMMNSLEVRTPLVDREVAEFVCKIPETMNFKKNATKTYTGKYLLKKLLMNDFDETFIHREKMGFTPPTLKWFSMNGENRNFAKELLLQSSSHILEYFEYDAVNDLFNQYNNQAFWSLWLLVVLEIWLTDVHLKNKIELQT